MFKEIKHINEEPNKIKNQIELANIARNSKIDRSETCFAGSSRQTVEEYLKGKERAKVLSKKWF